MGYFRGLSENLQPDSAFVLSKQGSKDLGRRLSSERVADRGVKVCILGRELGRINAGNGSITGH